VWDGVPSIVEMLDVVAETLIMLLLDGLEGLTVDGHSYVP
jgi:hypothetical protein